MRKIVMVIVAVILVFLYVSRQHSYTDLKQFQETTKQVEIKGEVLHPGVYEMDWNASIQDVIEEAGGILASGNCDSINQNQNIANHGVVVIPEKLEERCISINGDDAEMLDTLPGIGPVVAQRILEHRAITPFQSLEDIMDVKGIGEAMFQKMKTRICL